MIKKRWNLCQMRIMMENLRNLLGNIEVDMEIASCSSLSDNELDVLYLAYYNLKGRHLKYNRSIFGKIVLVEYEPRKYETIKYGFVESLLQTKTVNSFWYDSRPYNYGSNYYTNLYGTYGTSGVYGTLGNYSSDNSYIYSSYNTARGRRDWMDQRSDNTIR